MEEIDFGSLASDKRLGPFSILSTKAMPDIFAAYQLVCCPYMRVSEAMKSVENEVVEGDRYNSKWLTKSKITK